jgi:hypothetical protein
MIRRNGTIETLEGEVWDFDGAGKPYKNVSGLVPMYTYTYYGWVTSKKTTKGTYARGDQRRMIGQGTSPNKAQAKQLAAAQGLATLKAHYEAQGKKWFEPHRDPYESDQSWKGFLKHRRQSDLRKAGAKEVFYGPKPVPPPPVDLSWMAPKATASLTKGPSASSAAPKASSAAPKVAATDLAAKDRPRPKGVGRTWVPKTTKGGEMW